MHMVVFKTPGSLGRILWRLVAKLKVFPMIWCQPNRCQGNPRWPKRSTKTRQIYRSVITRSPGLSVAGCDIGITSAQQIIRPLMDTTLCWLCLLMLCNACGDLWRDREPTIYEIVTKWSAMKPVLLFTHKHYIRTSGPSCPTRKLCRYSWSHEVSNGLNY
jgi:hypothetical protein